MIVTGVAVRAVVRQPVLRGWGDTAPFPVPIGWWWCLARSSPPQGATLDWAGPEAPRRGGLRGGGGGGGGGGPPRRVCLHELAPERPPQPGACRIDRHDDAPAAHEHAASRLEHKLAEAQGRSEEHT